VLLEVLHLAFMLLGLLARGKRAQVPPFSLGVSFLRIESVLSRFEFSNHIKLDAFRLHRVARGEIAGWRNQARAESDSL
jgi:hypothetical protein